MGSMASRGGVTTQVRREDGRGRPDWGWLDSRHTFSFGEDPVVAR